MAMENERTPLLLNKNTHTTRTKPIENSSDGDRERKTRIQVKERKPVLLKLRASKTLLLVTVCMASFTVSSTDKAG